MKPTELIKGNGEVNSRVHGHADVLAKLHRYQHKDCVIAYYKEKLSTIFIIEGKVKYFAFVHAHPELYFGGYDYNTTNIALRKAIEIMGDDVIITDKEQYSKMIKTMIVEAL
jgi:hypothetical protein